MIPYGYMAYYFSPSQILTMAAENEVAGQSFYTSLAAVVPSEDTKKYLHI